MSEIEQDTGHILKNIHRVANHVCHRRLIGRRFDDPTVKKDIESWPFKVIDDGTQPKVEVEYLGETKTFSAQEISSMVLLKVCSYTYPHTCAYTYTNNSQ